MTIWFSSVCSIVLSLLWMMLFCCLWKKYKKDEQKQKNATIYSTIAVLAFFSNMSEGLALYLFGSFFTVKTFFTWQVKPYNPPPIGYAYGFCIFYFIYGAFSRIFMATFVLRFIEVAYRIQMITSSLEEIEARKKFLEKKK